VIDLENTPQDTETITKTVAALEVLKVRKEFKRIFIIAIVGFFVLGGVGTIKAFAAIQLPLVFVLCIAVGVLYAMNEKTSNSLKQKYKVLI